MAEKIGLDRSFIADVERGKRNISILNLDIIAKGFKLSLARLLSKL
jgi:transcriptional regulator with XRE-family HTH domain